MAAKALFWVQPDILNSCKISPSNQTNTHIIPGSVDIGREEAGIGYHDRQHPPSYWIVGLFCPSFPARWPGNSLSGRPDMQQLSLDDIAGFGRGLLALLRQRRDRTNDYFHSIYSVYRLLQYYFILHKPASKATKKDNHFFLADHASTNTINR